MLLRPNNRDLLVDCVFTLPPQSEQRAGAAAGMAVPVVTGWRA